MNHNRVIYRGPGKVSRQTRSTKLPALYATVNLYATVKWSLLFLIWSLYTDPQGVNVISPSAKFYWINIQSIKKFTIWAFNSTNQNWGIRRKRQFLLFQPEFNASTLLFNHLFPLILGISYGYMVRFRGRDWVKSIFLDSNVDPGTCLPRQDHIY